MRMTTSMTWYYEVLSASPSLESPPENTTLVFDSSIDDVSHIAVSEDTVYSAQETTFSENISSSDDLSAIEVTTEAVFSSEEPSFTENTTSYVTTEPEVIQIVTDTITEQVLTLMVLIFFWVYINFWNTFLMYVIRKEPQLRMPQYMVLSSYMICDLIYINSSLPHMIILVISNHPTFIPLWICQYSNVITAGVFFSMAHMVGYMAYERFIIFFRPLTYNSFFSPKKIIITSLCIHLFGQTYAIVTNALFGRNLATTALHCQPSAAGLLYLNPITAALFFIPSVCMSFYVLFRLSALITKHKAQVSALSSGNEASQEEKQRKKQVFSGKRAIKMVALVSGSFLGTTIPFVFIRVALFSSGVTWKQTDARENIVDFAITRLCYLAVTLLSSVANPAIYLYAQNDLRRLVKKHLGIKVHGSELETSAT